MFNPKFTYTDKMVSNLIKLENYHATIQSFDLTYDAKNRLGIKSKSLNVFHIANILNENISLKDSEKIVLGIKPEIEDHDKFSILVNFKNTQEFIKSGASDNFSEFDNNIFLELNKQLVLSWKENWDAKYRNFNEKIDDRWDSFVQLRDPEIKGNQIELELNDLIEWYKQTAPTVTPIVRIAIVFYRLIEICPFIAGNKLTLLMILDHILQRNQFSTKVYSSTIKIIQQNEEKLVKAFNLSKRNYELTIWIENFVEVLMSDLIEVRESINEFIIEDEKSQKQPFLELNKRQMKVLKYLQNIPTIRREDYCHLMDVSTMTAFRDLNDLVRKKLLKIDGQGRGTKYRLASM